ncbi:hypothetical protein [Mesorhizobium sp.]|uniref:hypothetical protein n=1 Tax=Mesorhizobium sp. TaxID=1871066 RepID=UPI00338E963A
MWLAAQGIGLNDGEHLLLADDADGLPTASLRLLRDPALGRNMAAHALELCRRNYSHAVVAARIQRPDADARAGRSSASRWWTLVA